MSAWDHMTPETVRWIQGCITEATDWVMSNIRAVYIEGPYGNIAPSGFEEALDKAVNGLNGAWMISSTQKAQEILDRFPGLEDRFPGLGGGSGGGSAGGDWSGLLTRPDSWSDNVDKVVSSALNPFTNFMYAMQAPRLRQYFSLYWDGYISKSELLAFSGAYSMEHFYTVAGADPSFMNPIKTARENRQMTDAQLVSRMGLDNINQVNKILGMDWRMALDMKEILLGDGFNLTMSESQILTNAYINDLKTNMTRADAQFLEGLANEMTTLGLDSVPLEYRSLVVNETLEEVTAIVADGPQSVAAYFAQLDGVPMLTANAMSEGDAPMDLDFEMPKEEKKAAKASVAGGEVNADLIQSQIALAMRQIDGESGSEGGIFADVAKFTSFASVSFASPFEEKSSFGAKSVA